MITGNPDPLLQVAAYPKIDAAFQLITDFVNKVTSG